MLTDLDELLLTVRDQDSRTYVREAILAYRSGALRAAVVSTWVSVIYDIISKLRILESQGDLSAKKLVQELEGAIKSNNIKAMSGFEDRLPDEALNTFEFLSQSEHEDLSRLKSDRNRCAHPAFGGDTLLYGPSPEAVRAHIVHAIRHLLSRPPIQGKAAIDKILADISGPNFPADQEDATKLLSSRYLDHAKDSLVVNLIKVLVKSLLQRSDPPLAGHETAASLALVAVSQKHSALYKTTIKDLLNRINITIDDQKLAHLLELVGTDPSLWELLDESTHIKIRTLIENCSPNSGGNDAIITALSIDALRKAVLEKFRELDESDLQILLKTYVKVELADVAIDYFSKAGSFRDAESRARLVLWRYGKVMTVTQIRRALEVVPTNNQIWDAAGMPDILVMFTRTTRRHAEALKPDWERMMLGVMENESSWPGASEVAKKKWAELIGILHDIGCGPFEWKVKEVQL